VFDALCPRQLTAFLGAEIGLVNARRLIGWNLRGRFQIVVAVHRERCSGGSSGTHISAKKKILRASNPLLAARDRRPKIARVQVNSLSWDSPLTTMHPP